MSAGFACMSTVLADPAGAKPQPPMPPPPAVREALVQQFDKDGDGVLSPEERQAAREYFQSLQRGGPRQEGGPREDRAAMRARMLAMFDKDGDGQLDEQELAEAQAYRKRVQAVLLEHFDADGDGVLSPEERQAARAALASLFHEHGRPGPAMNRGQGGGRPPEAGNRGEGRAPRDQARGQAEGQQGPGERAPRPPRGQSPEQDQE